MKPAHRKAMQDALGTLEAIVEEMTLGERYTNAGQYVLDSIPALRNALAEPAPEPVAWYGLTDVQWMNIVNKNSAWLGYSVEDAVHEAVRLTEARLKANNTATVLGAAPKPVASIYITPDGEREVDDWKVALPVGRNELYAAPVREPVPLLTQDDVLGIMISTKHKPIGDVIRLTEKAVHQKAGL